MPQSAPCWVRQFFSAWNVCKLLPCVVYVGVFFYTSYLYLSPSMNLSTFWSLSRTQCTRPRQHYFVLEEKRFETRYVIPMVCVLYLINMLRIKRKIYSGMKVHSESILRLASLFTTGASENIIKRTHWRRRSIIFSVWQIKPGFSGSNYLPQHF